MDNVSLMNNLKKVLPNIDIRGDSEIQNAINSELPHDTKIIRILSIYFNKKKSQLTTLYNPEYEAKYIKRLFPAIEFSYILEQLHIFKDMPNCMEIVLRIIIHSKALNKEPDFTSPVKRTASNELLKDYSLIHPIKSKKMKREPTSTIVKKQQKLLTPQQKVTADKLSLQPASVLDLSGNAPKENNNLCTNVPTINVNSLPVATPNEKDSMVCLKYSNAIERQIENGFNLAVITDNDLPVAQHCTITSTVEPQEITVVPVQIQQANINIITENNKTGLDYLKEVISSMEHFNENPSILDRNGMNDVVTIAQNDSNNVLDLSQTSNENLYVVSDVQPNLHSYANEIPPPSTEIRNDTPSCEAWINDLIQTSQNEEMDFLNVLQTTVENEPITVNSIDSETHLDGAMDCNDIAGKNIPDNVNSSTNNSHNFNNPSTSQDQVGTNANGADFDLVAYLHEISNAPANVIHKECDKLNIPTWTRPTTPILQVLVDNLLTTKISSESSDGEDDDDDDDDDDDEVQAVETIFNNQLFNPVLPKNILKLTHKLPRAHFGIAQNAVSPTASTSNKLSSDLSKLPNKEKNYSNTSVNSKLVNYLCGVFPDACPDYIRGLCKNQPMSNEILDNLTTDILNTNGEYPKRPPVNVEPDIFPKNQYEILKEFLPDADPDYLRMMCDRCEGKPNMVKTFLNEAMERRNYPTVKDYQRRQQLSAQEKQYTTDFSVENFIKVIPDPHAFFADASRTVKMDNLSSHYALVFLRNKFNKLPIRIIQSTFTKNGCKLYTSFKELQNCETQGRMLMKSTRKPMEMPNSIQNIPLLQEIAYISHEKAINEYLEEIKNKEEAEKKEALNNGLMKTCGCCYDEEVLPRNIFQCESGCAFCKSCVVKSIEVRFGEGKLDSPCLMNCASHFSLQTLQAVLSPKLFSKIAQKKALQEIKSAGIEELEMCPFCDFATIPAEGYNIFTCLNPECMKESCRLCKQPSHIPLRCEEIEKDEEVKARTFVENKMTEALLKKCWQCGIKFFKEEGCNKMTCSCGAQMCYVCGSPVTDYKHFNGNGGDRFDLCPLYSDTNTLNRENVLKGAEQAKAEIGNKKLKHDPTKDVQQHYKERAAKVPREHLVVRQPREQIYLARLEAREAQVRAIYRRFRAALNQHGQRLPWQRL